MTSQTPVCPTPQKKRYATREAADSAARGVQIAITQPLYPYVCSCTWWHLSKNATNELPANITADPADVERLHGMTTTQFRDLVATEASGKAADNDRLALRHPNTTHLNRWRDTLKELLDDIKLQLSARSTDTSPEALEWRRRAKAYRESLLRRINECHERCAAAAEEEKEARREAQSAKEKQEQAAKQARVEARGRALDKQLNEVGVPPMSQNELRRQAGEKAIKRLIDAHGIEFSRYLAEECEAIGAKVPNRVQRYLTDTPTDLARTA
jgi:hypothetical protein